MDCCLHEIFGDSTRWTIQFTIAEIFHCYAYEHINTSGLGVVQIKNDKWKMILHLSAPEGHSINDYIRKDEFSLHYSTIDDAVALMGRFERGALMAKLDLLPHGPYPAL